MEAPSVDARSWYDQVAVKAGGAMQTQDLDWATRLGELAVYPGYGVVRLEAIDVQEVGGARQEFLVLRRMEDGARILIPRSKSELAGLRGIVEPKEANRAWEVLQPSAGPGSRSSLPWSRQFKVYQETLRTGVFLEIAGVLRDLLQLQRSKELSFAEHKVLDDARSQIVQELAASQGTEAESVEAKIRASFRD